MSLVRAGIALLWLAFVSLGSVGQETAPAEQTVPDEDTAPGEDAAPQPPDTRPLDEIFIPSEEISADEEIVFPVDI